MQCDSTKDQTLNFQNILVQEFKMQIGLKPINIVKYIIVCLIPFFSGFFCVWAFWNPIDNLNAIPIAIVNNDRDVCVIYDYQLANYTIDKNAHNFYDVTDQSQCSIKAKMMEKNGQKYNAKFISSMTDKIFSAIVTDKNKIHFEINQFSKNALDVDYVKGSGSEYTPIKYWSKTIIPTDFSRHLRSVYDLLFLFAISSNKDYKTEMVSLIEKEFNWFINNKVLFWGTFKENFLAGELIYILSQLKTTLLGAITDKVLLSFLEDFLVQNQQIIGVKIIDARISIISTMLEQLKIMTSNTLIKNFATFLSEIFNEKNRINLTEIIFNNKNLYEMQNNKWIGYNNLDHNYIDF